METVNVTVRMERQTRDDAARLFSGLGVSTTQAINMFLKQAVREQRIPFEVAARPAVAIEPRAWKSRTGLPHRPPRPRNPFTPKLLRLCKQDSCAKIQTS